MPDPDQEFLDALDQKLWNAADRRRSNLDDDARLFAKIRFNIDQSRTLATLRDTLLQSC